MTSTQCIEQIGLRNQTSSSLKAGGKRGGQRKSLGRTTVTPTLKEIPLSKTSSNSIFHGDMTKQAVNITVKRV